MIAKGELDRIIRVDHAGEFGAKRIYEGQLAVLGKSQSAPMIREMYEQELDHLREFENLAIENGTRPTVLHPLWNVAGFALGAVTALMGEKAAMACTAAVEEVIDEHYQKQIKSLPDSHPVKPTLEKFRQDEVHHMETALAHDAESAPFYNLLSGVIKKCSRTAIWLSERI